MKLRNVLGITVGVLAIQSAMGQVPVSVGGIAWTSAESFESLTSLGEYLHFGGFGGAANFVRYGGGWLRSSTTAFSGTKGLFLDQTDLTISFSSLKRSFGGHFRSADPSTTGMYVTFYRSGVIVGVTVFSSLSSSTWGWRGWDTGMLGGFDQVRIVGNGGFAGMIHVDVLRVR